MTNATTCTILVVDDDPAIRTFLADLLTDEGFVVETAPNGMAALDLLVAGLLPRLILLDLMMPLLDGDTFYLALQGDPALQAIPVLFVSAALRPQARLRAIGVGECVPKPLDIDQLVFAVRGLCGMPSP